MIVGAVSLRSREYITTDIEKHRLMRDLHVGFFDHLDYMEYQRNYVRFCITSSLSNHSQILCSSVIECDVTKNSRTDQNLMPLQPIGSQLLSNQLIQI